MKKLLTYILWIITALAVCSAGLIVYDDIQAIGMVRQWHVRHAFGGFQLQNTLIDITTQSWWVHITNGTNDLWIWTEADWMILSWDVMTIQNTGDYFWQLTIAVSWSPNNDICIRLWNITQSKQEWYTICWTTTSTSNYIPLSMPIYIEDDGGDEFRMEVANISASQDIYVRSSVFYMSYLHD